MATIREDVVSISFDVENNPFAELTADIQQMQRAVTGGTDSATSELQNIASSANSAAGGVQNLANAARNINGAGADSLAESVQDTQENTQAASRSFTELLRHVRDTARVRMNNNLDRLRQIPQQASQRFTQLRSNMQRIRNINLQSIGRALNNGLGRAITNCVRNGRQLVTRMRELARTSLQRLASSMRTLATHSLSVAKNLGKGLAKGVVKGVGAATVAVGGLVTASVKAYADYEQLVGGVDTLFKGSSKQIQQYANNAYKTAGLSANKYMETVTSFSASLISSVGGDTNKAAKLANMAITDMSDNANKMGTDMESIQNAYQGFAKQNYTMLDNLKLGYGGTKEEMQRLIKDAAKIDKSVDKNSMSYGNIVKALHAVQNKLGITGTTAKEAEKTISGSLSSLKAAWSNTLTALVQGGSSFDTCLDNLVNSAITFGKNVIPVIKKALTGVTKIVAELAPLLAAEIPKLLTDILPVLVNAAISMIDSLVKGIQSNISNLASAATQIVMSLCKAIISLLPQLITLGLQLIIALAQGIAQQLPTLVPLLVQGILDLANSIISQLPSFINAALQLVIGLTQGILAALPILLQQAPILIQNLVNAIMQSLPLIIQAAIQLINMLVQGLIQNLPLLIQSAIQIVQALVQGLANNMPMVVQAALQLINCLVTGLLQNLPLLINMSITLVLTLVDGLINNLPLLINAALQLIVGITAGLLQNLPKIILAALQIIVALGKGLIQAIPQLVAKIPQIITAIKEGLTSFDFASVGKDLMRGFANGIGSMAKTVANKAKSIAGSAAKTIKNALKIKSPSRVTFGYGEFTGEGLALGIQKMKDKVTTAAQGLSTNVSTAIQPSVNAYTPSGSAVSNTSNRATTNNFNPQFVLNMNGASATEANKHKVKQWVKESIKETFESMGRTNPELCEV